MAEKCEETGSLPEDAECYTPPQELKDYFQLFTSNLEFRNAFEKHRRDTLTDFCTSVATKNFTKSSTLDEIISESNGMPCIRWHFNLGLMSIPYLGYPFIMLGHTQFHCAQGKDVSLSQKSKFYERRTQPKRHLSRPTKKVGCPVTMAVKKIYIFPEFKLDKDTKRNRAVMSAKVKQLLKEHVEAKKRGEEVEDFGSLLYLTKEFPSANVHKYHVEQTDAFSNELAGMNQTLLYEGASFPSYKDAMEALDKYRDLSNVKLYCVSETAVRLHNPSLRYSYLKYVCINALKPKKYCGKGKNRRVVNSFKVGCEMHIRFGVSEDGSQLVVKSMSEEHNHEINQEAVVKEALHPELCNQVAQFVWADPSSTIDDVKRQLEQYVVNEMFKDQVVPPRTRRQYFPTKKQIRYFMTKARSSLNISQDVEQKLETAAEMLKEKHNDEKMIFNFKVKHSSDLNVSLDDTVTDGDEIFMAGDGESKSKENAKLLFCHQTPHQQRLLKRYNSKVFLKQVKDIHTRIPFPLFCMYVQTNVDYQLVAEFILQSNTSAMLSEGLQTIRDWNPGWNPKFVVCDCSDEQIAAVENVFNGTFILISDASRESTWLDWLNDEQNGVLEHRDEMLVYLKAIAQSFSEETLNTAARNLEESEVWKTSDKLRTWFQLNWLAYAKRWVAGYRPDDFLVTCHNGRTLEDELKVFRSLTLMNKGTPLQDVIQQLVEHVVPIACKQYHDLNKESLNVQNNLRYTHHDIPSYLSTLPGSVTGHIFERLRKASEHSYTLRCMHSGIFTVQGDAPEDDALHTVLFGDASSFPSCDCDDWHKFKLPCVHFCAIFSNFPGWNWDMLAISYKSLPQFNIDWGCEGNIELPGLLVDNSTQTSGANMLSSGNQFCRMNDKRSSDTPQVLAHQCRGLLQQLSKLQLAHHSREILYRLKSELKELLEVFSNAPKEKQPLSNPGAWMVLTKSVGRPRKIAPKLPSVLTTLESPGDKTKHVSVNQKKVYPIRTMKSSEEVVNKENLNRIASVFVNSSSKVSTSSQQSPLKRPATSSEANICSDGKKLKENTPEEQNTKDNTPKEQNTKDNTPEEQNTKDNTPEEQNTKDNTPEEQNTKDNTPEERNTDKGDEPLDFPEVSSLPPATTAEIIGGEEVAIDQIQVAVTSSTECEFIPSTLVEDQIETNEQEAVAHEMIVEDNSVK